MSDTFRLRLPRFRLGPEIEVAVNSLWQDFVTDATAEIDSAPTDSFDWYPGLVKKLESYAANPILEARVAAYVLAKQNLGPNVIPADRARDRAEDLSGLLIVIVQDFQEAFGEPSSVEQARSVLQNLVSMVAAATAQFLATVAT